MYAYGAVRFCHSAFCLCGRLALWQVHAGHKEAGHAFLHQRHAPPTRSHDIVLGYKNALKRRGCWRWRTRISRSGEGHRRSCSSGRDGGCGTRSGSGGTCCPCPCGCARGACGQRRPSGRVSKRAWQDNSARMYREDTRLLDEHVKVLGDLRSEACQSLCQSETKQRHICLQCNFACVSISCQQFICHIQPFHAGCSVPLPLRIRRILLPSPKVSTPVFPPLCSSTKAYQ